MREAPAREKNAMLTMGVSSARIWPISSCTPLLAASPLQAYIVLSSTRSDTAGLCGGTEPYLKGLCLLEDILVTGRSNTCAQTRAVKERVSCR